MNSRKKLAPTSIHPEILDAMMIVPVVLVVYHQKRVFRYYMVKMRAIERVERASEASEARVARKRKVVTAQLTENAERKSHALATSDRKMDSSSAITFNRLGYSGAI